MKRLPKMYSPKTFQRRVRIINMLLNLIHYEGFRLIYSKLDNRFHLDGIDTINLGTDRSCKSIKDIIKILYRTKE